MPVSAIKAFVPVPFDRPPVVEAIYGIQAVTAAELVPDEVMEKLSALLPPGFIMQQSMDHVNIELKREAEGPVQHKHTQVWSGAKLASVDGKVVAHFMRFGIFVSFTAYRSYEESRPVVQLLWAVYSETFKPHMITRLSIRYINLIKLPFENGRINLERYFQVHLRFPNELANTMEHFHQQFVIRDPATQVPARVMISNLREEDDSLVVAFDNEGYQESQWTPDDSRIWAELELVRNWTYQIFRTTLTEECLRNYND